MLTAAGKMGLMDAGAGRRPVGLLPNGPMYSPSSTRPSKSRSLDPRRDAVVGPSTSVEVDGIEDHDALMGASLLTSRGFVS
jgi:hypothetical protein